MEGVPLVCCYLWLLLSGQGRTTGRFSGTRSSGGTVAQFVVEALSAKAMYRTGRSAARPIATGLPLTRPGHRPPVGGAKPQRAAANEN